MKRLLSMLLLLPLALPVAAQYRTPSDSTLNQRRYAPSSFKATQLIAPGVLLAGGITIHCFAHEAVDYPIRDGVARWRGDKPERSFDNYIQYAPVVLDLGLGIAGVPAENGFVDRLVEASLAYATCAVFSGAAKAFIYSPRPNGANNQSFPSGHTDLVFTGAELVRMEYGWGWGAGAYAVATTVAVMRLYNNWHWFSDVLAGAGLGILCAHAGAWLMDPVKNLLGIRGSDWGSGRKPAPAVALAPTFDPYSGALCATFAMKF